MPLAKGPSSGFVPPCIPMRVHKPPMGPDWVHEIKHDGYRLQVRRDGDAVRLFTRRGYDWSARYPAIVLAAMRLRPPSHSRSTARRSYAVRMGSLSSTPCTAAARSARPCYLPLTSWSSMDRISAPYR